MLPSGLEASKRVDLNFQHAVLLGTGCRTMPRLTESYSRSKILAQGTGYAHVMRQAPAAAEHAHHQAGELTTRCHKANDHSVICLA